MLQRIIWGAAALLVWLSVVPAAYAQSDTKTAGVAVPENLTPESARNLVAELSDEQVRGLLLERLDAVAATQTAAKADETNAISELFHHSTSGAVGVVIDAVKGIPAMFTLQFKATSTFFENFGMVGFLTLLGYMAAVVAAGLAAEWVVNKLTSRWHTIRSDDPEPETLRQSLSMLAKRLCRELLGLFVFLAVGRTVGFSIVPPEMVPYTQLFLWNLVAAPRIAAAFGRFLLAPNQPKFRFVNTDDTTANFLQRHIVGFTLLVGITFVTVGFNALNGVPPGESVVGFWMNFALHLYVVWIAWTARDGLVMMMRGPNDGVSAVEEKVSRAYPYFAIGVALATWWVVNVIISYDLGGILQSGPHFKTMGLLLMAPALDTLVRGIVRHVRPPMSGEGIVAERAYKATEVSFVRIGRVIVFGIVIIQIAGFWGLTLGEFATGAVGEDFAANIIEFLMTIAVGYLLWEVVSVYVNRKLAAEMTASGEAPGEEEVGGDGGGAGKSRLSTVLPLILLTCRIAIVVLFTLTALKTLGIDTTPLLAGAGVLGLAIGFGAQKLVTDVVSGVFFLVDDAFRVGEYVDVGDVKGTVEKISVRSMQLRHHRGLVHTIPYGEIQKVTNFSRDWVIMKLKFTVPFDTDPERVRKMFKKIGQEVQAMDAFKDDMLQPFKSQGVFDFDDVGMVIRGKFMAKPGSQFMMRKEIYNRVKAAFNEADIEFARREVRVAMPELDEHEEEHLTDAEKTKLAAAATATVIAQEQQAQADQGKK
ncbi:MAG: mechanosensitive ion channel family protein [Paracoccaceae bacterium]